MAFTKDLLLDSAAYRQASRILLPNSAMFEAAR
jgi:hypothetical protein